MARWHRRLSFEVDPDAVAMYTFRWARWLPAGLKIIDHEILSDGTVTIVGSMTNGSDVTVWLSGVTDRASVTCRVTTDGAYSLVDDRTIRLRSVQK